MNPEELINLKRNKMVNESLNDRVEIEIMERLRRKYESRPFRNLTDPEVKKEFYINQTRLILPWYLSKKKDILSPWKKY